MSELKQKLLLYELSQLGFHGALYDPAADVIRLEPDNSRAPKISGGGKSQGAGRARQKSEIPQKGRKVKFYMSNFNLDVKVFPIDIPKGSTMAFASVAIDDLAAIRGVRVIDSEKGLFVSMPQSKDKNGEYHDVAFPLSGDVRKAISKTVLSEYKQQTAQRKQSIEGRLANGAKRAAQHSANAPQRSAARKTPGLGD